MLQALGKPTVLISSFALMSVMFVIVMFIVNPSIDGKDGSGVLELQLTFKKDVGVDLLKSWGESGVNNFKKWIFTDYIYAFTYSLFFASLISYLDQKKRPEFQFTSIYFVCIAFLTGALDCLENSMELSFISNPYSFSANLFFVHSIVASLKWLAVAILVIYILALLIKKNESNA